MIRLIRELRAIRKLGDPKKALKKFDHLRQEVEEKDKELSAAYETLEKIERLAGNWGLSVRELKELNK